MDNNQEIPSISFDELMNENARQEPKKRHPNQTLTTKDPKQQKACRTWTATGACKFGNKCRFLHDMVQDISRNFVELSMNNDNDNRESGLGERGGKKILNLKKKTKNNDKTRMINSSAIENSQQRDIPKRNSIENDIPKRNSNNSRRTFANDINDSPRNSAYSASASASAYRGSARKLWTNDKPSPPTPTSKQRAKKNVYTRHLSHIELLAGVQDKRFFQGVIRINKRNRYEAYVRIEGMEDTFIAGLKNQNRALDGDIVVGRHLRGEELEKEKAIEAEKKATKTKQNQERQAKVNFFEEQQDEFEFQETREYGTILGIIESTTRTYQHVGVLSFDRPGTLDEEKSKNVQRFMWFKPNDKRVPFILIPSQIVPSEIIAMKDQFEITLYTAKITGWIDTSIYPLGAFTGKLGQIGELPAESEALLKSNGIYWEDFSDEPFVIPEKEFSKRLDLRQERIFSIDPPTARDLDDAVSIKSLDDGTFELGVHIADVSYFVSPGTPVDSEAYNRATSVYLVQKVIPMLPRLLCEELCSLNPQVDRLAYSVIWNIDKDANIIGEPKFARTVINSCAKLWYDHAQAVIDGRDWNKVNPVSISGDWTAEQVQQDIMTLFSLSQCLRAKRYENGSLALNSIKLWFKLDDVGNPNECGLYESKEANKLIEEFMLLANMAVAKKISSHFPEAALLRRHPPPLEKGLEGVIEILGKEGIVLDPTSAGSLHDSLLAIKDEEKQRLSRYILIKSMKRAEYFSTGSVDISTFFHYALATPLYAHFTSPIRRYCDLVVHRLLDLALHDSESPYSTSRIDDIATQCNVRKFASRDAQDASQKLFLCTYLAQKQQNESPEGIIAEGAICGVGPRAFDVLIPVYGILARVWLEDSLDQGKIAGVQGDAANQKLKIYWKRETRLEEENEQDCESTVGLDPNTHFTQTIGMFDHVQVSIVVNMKQTPPSFKLFAVNPLT